MPRAKKVENGEVQEKEEEVIMLDQVFPVENILKVRFVDKDGNLFRLDEMPGHARGDYRLRPA